MGRALLVLALIFGFLHAATLGHASASVWSADLAISQPIAPDSDQQPGDTTADHTQPCQAHCHVIEAAGTILTFSRSSAHASGFADPTASLVPDIPVPPPQDR